MTSRSRLATSVATARARRSSGVGCASGCSCSAALGAALGAACASLAAARCCPADPLAPGCCALAGEGAAKAGCGSCAAAAEDDLHAQSHLTLHIMDCARDKFHCALMRDQAHWYMLIMSHALDACRGSEETRKRFGRGSEDLDLDLDLDSSKV